MMHGTYIGPIPYLAGRTALLMERGNSLMAQFDRHDTVMPEGHEHVKPGTKLVCGWHQFNKYDWNIE